MIRALNDTDHVAVYRHSGKVWLIYGSERGVSIPMEPDIAEAIGLEMFQQARRLKRGKG